MLIVNVTPIQTEFESSQCKVFRCPSCGTKHTYYYAGPRYCDNDNCTAILPDVSEMMRNVVLQIQWHFGKYT